MSIIVPVKDGKVVDETASADSVSQATKSSNSALDKEAFLQLLVAQMKYQDPLEPTSNTEYISQLATFSSLEEMQNLNASMESQQAANLIGKTVIMKVTSTTGASNVVQGRVDYIVKERGRLYLSIDDKLYSLDDLDRVIDDDYLDAISIAEDFKKVMDELPDPKKLTLKDKDDLEIVRKAYNSLTTYQQQMIEKYYPSALKKLQELLAEMKKMDQSADDDSEEDKEEGDKEGDDKTEGTSKE
ncbi:flagellar hook capping protein [Lachnospiraceae bacterium]|nr:flagellar hook capping protein [Lachnospiraceae bacterium]